MDNVKPKLGQEGLFEEDEVVVSLPYNLPIERVLKDTTVFDIQVFRKAGEKPYIKVRYPKVIEQK